MYCPKCSQPQVSDEMRFCSRCGFPLSAVRELVASGGGLVEREADAQVGQPAPALKGMRKGVWMMLAGVPLTLVVALLTVINDAFAVLGIVPVLCFVAGFVRLLYGTFLQERTPRVKRDALQPRLGPELPTQGGTTPIEGFTAQRLQTAEMTQPPSVTESTTRLLDGESSLDRK